MSDTSNTRVIDDEENKEDEHDGGAGFYGYVMGFLVTVGLAVALNTSLWDDQIAGEHHHGRGAWLANLMNRLGQTTVTLVLAAIALLILFLAVREFRKLKAFAQ
ncbi:hypothetical protein [Kitasatospora sp. GP82]|uniref:hypothetical protein n=1 Tax=Kitasatospora sp. GP82 TaxID=3035089 RepID=UPI002476FD3F|nr:hypothetical protein [Kitasatospora sp. GP82]MDH6125498.1 hypothetical protein [Kitasatospora sp. GP82]